MDKIPDLTNIPKQPGCYIFRNKCGEIIYIGKSKSLFSRVRQYFYASETAEYNKYTELAREVRDIETIITATETDALILECRLIRAHKPRYNRLLKKTHRYPYIRIDTAAVYPSITVVDGVSKDGCQYFGSFYDNDDAKNAVELIGSIWRTPVCRKDSFTEGGRPCLNYHIGKCCGPCSGMIEREPYRQKIAEIIKCLRGDYKPILRRLNNEMRAAAGLCEFEKAAVIRDGIEGLKRLVGKQKRLFTDLDNRDVYLFLRAFNEQRYFLFFIRDGVTLNRIDFPSLDEPDLETLEAVVLENKNGKINVEDGIFLTACLLDIGASKYFVPVGKKAGISQTAVKLRNGFREFIMPRR